MMKPTLNIINANNADTDHNCATPANATTNNVTTENNATDKPAANRRRVSTRPTNRPLPCVPNIDARAFTANNHPYVCGDTPNSFCETNENADTYVNNIPKLNPSDKTGPMNRRSRTREPTVANNTRGPCARRASTGNDSGNHNATNTRLNADIAANTQKLNCQGPTNNNWAPTSGANNGANIITNARREKNRTASSPWNMSRTTARAITAPAAPATP